MTFPICPKLSGETFPRSDKNGARITDLLKFFPSLTELPELYEALAVTAFSDQEEIARSQMVERRPRSGTSTAIQILTAKVKQAEESAYRTLAHLNSFALQSAEIVDEMKFDFLLDDERKIFSIGYNVRPRTMRQFVLRSARLRSATDKFCRNRQRRNFAGTLVPTWSPAHAR